VGAYLLIESRDPFESNDVANSYDVAAGLARERNIVTLFLVQNGVLATRKGARVGTLGDLARLGIEVLADEFSLRERGIGADHLTPGVRPAPIDIVIDHLAEGRKVFWY
jgi:hypothetical protein